MNMTFFNKLLLIGFLISATGFDNSVAQTTFNGNTNTGFGGVLGDGDFSISDDGTTVTLTFNRGTGNFNDALVIYIDSKSGGFSSTSGFTDTGDYLRRAISGFDTGPDPDTRATLNFPSNFQADYAIALDVTTSNFGGLWELVNGGSHSFVTSVTLTPSTGATESSYSMTFGFTDIASSSGTDAFRFVATYLNPDNSFRSNEAIGGGFGGTNPGASAVTMTTFFAYSSGSEGGISTTTQAGDWNNAATWVGNRVPFEGDQVTIAHNVTLNQNATVSSLTIDAAATLTSEASAARVLTIQDGGSLTNNGTFTANDGTLAFAGSGSLAGSSTTTLNNLSIAGGVAIPSTATVNGTATIQTGGYFALTAGGAGVDASANLFSYGPSSTLRYEGTFSFGTSGDNFGGGWGTTSSKSPANLELGSSGDLTITESMRNLSGNVTIESGGALITNDLLTLEDGAEIKSTGGITGNISFQRELTGAAGWRLLGVPVASATYDNLLSPIWTQGFTGANTTNGNPNVFTYNEATAGDANQGWTAIPDQANTFSNAQGIAVYVYQDDDGLNTGSAGSFPKTLSVSGSEPTTDQSPTVNYTDNGNSAADGWNLLHNPFAATIDWDAGWTRTNLDATVYTWNPATNQYITWNGSTGDLTDGLITPLQAFWVKANAASPAITIPTAAKSNTTGSFVGKAQNEPLALRLALEAEDRAAALWLHFDEDASIGMDPLDAYSLAPMASDYAQIRLFAAENWLQTLSLPIALEEELLLPLHAEVVKEGSAIATTVQLRATLANLPENVTIELLDRDTDQRYALDQQFSATFDLEASAVAKEANDQLNATKVPALLSTAEASESRFALIIKPANTTSVEELSNDLPENIQLEQNYPNPFNPSTTIAFSVAEPTAVRLEVFNSLGQPVALLANQIFTAGRHQLRWDAANLPTGLYIYRLEAGGQYLVRRMTLIK